MPNTITKTIVTISLASLVVFFGAALVPALTLGGISYTGSTAFADGDGCGDGGSDGSGSDSGGSDSSGASSGGGGEGGGYTDTGYVAPVILTYNPAPTCVLNASNSSIVAGNSTVLSYVTANATTASISSIGSVSISGSYGVSPSVTTTYIMTVSGAGGTATCSRTITVTAATPAPTCTLTANPVSVGYNGSSTLSWSTNNATSASINQGIGSVMLSGGYSLSNISGTRTYTMTVSGPGGTNTCQTTVIADSVSNTLPTCSISASPSSVSYGGTTYLSWNTSNATNATLTDVGGVALSGSYAMSGIYGTRTYTLTVTGNGGSNSCSTTVYVQNQASTVPTCSLDSTSVTTQGGQATLYWSTNNATSVSISGIGSVATSGSYMVYPSGTTTYVLSAYGNGGSVSCTKTITVNTYPTYYDTPSCSLTVTPAIVYNNGGATLNWTTANATYVTLDNGIGQVGTSGSYSLGQVTGTRTYTMTVSGNNGTRTCTVNVVSAQNVNTGTSSGTVLGASTGGPTCGIVVRPTTISGGQMATLAWYAQNASSVTINGIGSVANSGTYAIAPSQTTTYNMTVRGYSGEVRTCDATILVSATGAYYPQVPTNNSGIVLGASTEDILPLREVPYTGAEDVIYPMFIVALALTAFYGVSRMGKQVYA